jgi:3-oxoacyl-[acyl-carrier protein] reductase
MTGGWSGIDRGIARAPAEEEVGLAIASRNPDPATIEDMRSLGIRCMAIRANVSRKADVVRMVAEAINDLGGRVDLFVSNAAWVWHRPLTKIDGRSWHATIDTNLSACLSACREACRHMVERRAGSIVIVGSTSRFTISCRETAYWISKMGFAL